MVASTSCGPNSSATARMPRVAAFEIVLRFGRQAVCRMPETVIALHRGTAARRNNSSRLPAGVVHVAHEAGEGALLVLGPRGQGLRMA